VATLDVAPGRDDGGAARTRGQSLDGIAVDGGHQVRPPADERDRTGDHRDHREPQQWLEAPARHGQHQGHDRQRERGVSQQQRVEQCGDAEEDADTGDRGPTAASGRAPQARPREHEHCRQQHRDDRGVWLGR